MNRLIRRLCTLLTAALLFGAIACTMGNRTTPLHVDTTHLRSGDLLFRMGMGAESYVVTAMSQGEYSHVGIALLTDSGWMVLHAVPGEAEETGGIERLKCEPIATFYGCDRAQRGATARVACTDSMARCAALYALRKVGEGICFDNDYTADDSTQFYCSELVWRAYRHVGIDLVDNRRHSLIAGPPRDPVIYPQDILDSPHVGNLQVLY